MAEDIVTLGFSFNAGNAENAITRLISNFEKLSEAGEKSQKTVSGMFPASFSADALKAVQQLDKITQSLEITSAKAVETAMNLQKIKIDQKAVSPAPLIVVRDEIDTLTTKAKGAGIALASIFTTAKIIKFGKNTVETFAASEDAAKRLEASFRRIGISASAYIPQFQIFSAELSKITRFRSTEIMSGFAQLANFGIPIDKIRDAERAAMGLSTAYGIQLSNAIRIVGRAYNGSIQGLAHYGIVLNKAATAEEKFNQLLQIGGNNFQLVEADAKSFSGAMAQVENTWKTTSAIIGGTFAPTVQTVGSGLKSMLAGFNAMDPAAQRFIVQTATIAAGAVALKTTLAGLNLIQMQTAKVVEAATIAEKSRVSIRELEAEVALKAARAEYAEGESVRKMQALIAAETAERKARIAAKKAEQQVSAAKATGSSIEVKFAKSELTTANTELSRMTANLQAAQIASAKANLETVKAAAALQGATAALNQETAAVAKNTTAKKSAIAAFLMLGNTAQASGVKIAAAAVTMNVGRKALYGITAAAHTAGTALKSLVAALGPIGIGLIALQGITAIYDALDLSGKRLSASFDNQVSGLDRMLDQLAQARQKTDQYAASAKSGIASLQELAKYNELTVTGQQAASAIVQELNEHYNDLGVTYDETTGKIVGLDGANTRLTETYRKQIAAQSQQILITEQEKLNALRSKSSAIMQESMSVIDWMFRSGELEADQISRIQANSAEIQATMQRIGELKRKIAAVGQAEIGGQPEKAQAALQIAQREEQLRQRLADKKWSIQFENSDALNQLDMIRRKITEITATRTAAEQAIAGKLATPEGEKESWEEKRINAEMQLLDLQKQEGDILRDGYKKAQAEAEKLRQKMFSAYQNTVKMVLENDKFKAHTAKAVSTNSIEALTLQSRSFDAIPKIAAPTMIRDQNLNVAQNALTVSTNTAATALQSFATQLAALHMNYPGLGGVSAAVTVSPQNQIAKTSAAASTGSGQQAPVPVTIQQPEGGAMDGMTVDLSKLETSAGDINTGILAAVQELKSAVRSLQQIKGTVSGLSIVSY